MCVSLLAQCLELHVFVVAALKRKELVVRARFADGTILDEISEGTVRTCARAGDKARHSHPASVLDS